MGMRRIRIKGASNRGSVWLAWGGGGTLAELTVANIDEGRATVMLEHHSGVRVMAGLGAFIAASTEPPLPETSAMDRAGHEHQGVVHLEQDTHSTLLLRVTNLADTTTAVVRLDRPAATTLMAHLGAYVATS
jgi:hypothetical protein